MTRLLLPTHLSTAPINDPILATALHGMRLVQQLSAALLKAERQYAVLGTDTGGDDWITDVKYEDYEGAALFVKSFDGTVHSSPVGDWVPTKKPV